MKKIKAYFKEKGFYLALSAGLAALVLLIGIYTVRRDVGILKGDATIDLGALGDEDLPSEAEEKAAMREEDKEVYSKVDKEKDQVYETTTEKMEVEEITTEAQSELEVEAVVSDGASPKEDIYSELSYNGERTLMWPVNGEVIMPYSMETTVFYETLNSYKVSENMLIKADENSDVLCPYDAVVKEVGATLEQGNYIIFALGNGYTMTISQLSNVSVNTGDKILCGEKIGTVAPVTNYYKQEGSHISLNIKKDDKSVDPLIYLIDAEDPSGDNA